MAEITVSEQIIEVLDYLGEKFGIVVDWNANNMIPIVQDLCDKYINWELATSIATLILLLIGAIAAIKLLQRGVKVAKGKDEFFQDEENAMWMFPIGFFALVICSGFAIHEVFDVIKCVTFPELKIYEYITELIKNLD